MTDLILPDPRLESPELFIPGKKPIGPVKINWNHLFTKELKVCVLFNGLKAELNHVTGKDHAITGAYARGVNARGQYLDMDGDTSNYLMVDGLAITLPFTMFLLFIPNSISTNYHIGMSLGHPSSVYYHFLRINVPPDFVIGTYDSSISPVLSLGNVSVNKFYSAGGVLEESSRSGILSNGAFNQNSSTSTTFTDTLTRAAFDVTADSTPYQGLDAKYYMGCIWNESKSEGFLRSMNQNPYQFLEPA